MAVHILTKDRFVSADRTYDVECKSSGSKPPALITWWKGTKQLKKLTKNVSLEFTVLAVAQVHNECAKSRTH